MGTISKPNTFSSSTTISSSEVNDNFDVLYNEVNGNISAANLATDSVTTAKIADSNVTTAKIADDAVTSAKLAEAFIRGRYQANTTNSSPTGLILQHGWGFLVGDGANTYRTEAITYPTAFSSAPIVIVTYLGFVTTGTTPTSPASFASSHHTAGAMTINAYATTTTGFNIAMRLYTTMPTNQNQGYSWIAIGPA